MSGKGDKPRPVDKKKFDDNFERIFKKDTGLMRLKYNKMLGEKDDRQK
jgi:hypothetical protein